MTSEDTVINGTDGADYITTNYLRSDTTTHFLYANGGNDSIYNYADYIVVDSGNGNDYIDNRNSGEHATVLTGEGNDIVYNSNSYQLINGGSGSDSVYVSGYHNTVYAGQGDDTIKSSGNQNIIYAEQGWNTIEISNGNNNVTAISGDGNDTIQIGYAVSHYSSNNVLGAVCKPK